MRSAVHIVCVTLSIAALIAAACQYSPSGANADHHEKSPWKGIVQGVAVMIPTEGNTARGTVTFTQAKDHVKVDARIEGLNPNAKHAIHIHQWGDIRMPNGKGTGGHFNPDGHDHGLPEKKDRHAGDLGNLQADANGKATYSIVVKNVTVVGHKNPIIGRGVIIHAKQDDGGQPTGNAGARISQGVIGIAMPAQ